MHIPILMIEDYNGIAVERDKKGGRFPVSQKIYDFRSFIIEAGLYDFGFIGATFMWCNE